MLSRRTVLKLMLLGGLPGCVIPSRITGNVFLPADDNFRTELDTPEMELYKPHDDTWPHRETETERTGTFIPDISVRPRWKWTSAPLLKWRLAEMGKIRLVTVHHEGSPGGNRSQTAGQVKGDLQRIRRLHLRKMRAGDIGYHYIIDRAGRIWQGRPVEYQGAHAGGRANRGNVGIMLLGNFENQEPTREQKLTLKAFLKEQMRRYGLSRRRIYTHRELKVTKCPGRNLQRYMNRIRPAL